VEARFDQLLREVGAIKAGHFLLASGKHSDLYIEKFDLLRRPRDVEILLKELAGRFKNESIDVVVGPTTGGILLAFELARQLGTMAAYAERKLDGQPGREFRRGTLFKSAQRVLVIDDVLTTGGSIRETLEALKLEPVTIMAIAVLVDRSGGSVDFEEIPLVTLLTIEAETWSPEECPLCRSAIPLQRPGTTNRPGE
jgi:orotate phosphoribosyltransferase